MEADACNPSTLEAKARGSFWVQGQPDLYNILQGRQYYAVRPFLKEGAVTTKDL